MRLQTAPEPHFPKLSLRWIATKMTITMALRRPLWRLQTTDAAVESLSKGLYQPYLPRKKKRKGFSLPADVHSCWTSFTVIYRGISRGDDDAHRSSKSTTSPVTTVRTIFYWWKATGSQNVVGFGLATFENQSIHLPRTLQYKTYVDPWGPPEQHRSLDEKRKRATMMGFDDHTFIFTTTTNRFDYRWL
jgi:hypothetical protein